MKLIQTAITRCGIRSRFRFSSFFLMKGDILPKVKQCWSKTPVITGGTDLKHSELGLGSARTAAGAQRATAMVGMMMERCRRRRRRVRLSSCGCGAPRCGNVWFQSPSISIQYRLAAVCIPSSVCRLYIMAVSAWTFRQLQATQIRQNLQAATSML
jgi:hypothetical protein